MRNIKLLYLIIVLRYAWFWLGSWVLYYSSFGGFTAVGILEMVMIVSSIVFEIPTGAVADLFGKRKSLMIGFLIVALGSFWMGLAPSLLHMAMSLILMNLGYALTSGTYEAIMYDSLKDEGKEDLYNKTITNSTSFSLIALALFGAIGGYFYNIFHGLPFILTGVFSLLAIGVAYFLVEPRVDSEKFTFKNYLKQNKDGIKELFKNIEVARITIVLLVVMIVTLMMHEGLNDMLLVSLGYSAVQLGYLISLFYVLAAFISNFATKFRQKKTKELLFLGSVTVYALTMVIGPFAGIIAATFLIALRFIIDAVLGNEISTQLNEVVSSKYRATALSAFTMLKGIPYAFLILWMGSLADMYPVQNIIGYLGVFLGVVVIFLFATLLRKKKLVANLPD